MEFQLITRHDHSRALQANEQRTDFSLHRDDLHIGLRASER